LHPDLLGSDSSPFIELMSCDSFQHSLGEDRWHFKHPSEQPFSDTTPAVRSHLAIVGDLSWQLFALVCKVLLEVRPMVLNDLLKSGLPPLSNTLFIDTLPGLSSYPSLAMHRQQDTKSCPDLTALLR